MDDKDCKKLSDKFQSDSETVYRIKVSFDEHAIVNQVKCCIEKNILRHIDTASEK